MEVQPDPSRPPSSRFHPVWIVLAAILIQFAFLVALPGADRTNQSVDYVVFYAPVAQNILAGRGLVTADGRLASEYPPGFPMYLAANSRLADVMGVSRDDMIIAANVVLMALSCLFVFLLAESIFNRRVAFVAAFLWITYVFNLWLIKQPNSEVPFLLLFVCAFWFVLRGANRSSLISFVTAGALLGLSALVRPVALFLPLVFGSLLLIQSYATPTRRFMHGLAIVGTFLIVVFPWEVKLTTATDHIVPLSTNGPSSMIDGLTFASKTGKGGDRAWVPADVSNLAWRVRDRQRSMHSVGDVMGFMAIQARQDPKGVLEMGITKSLRSWYGTNAMWHERPTALIQAGYLLLIAPGIWLSWRRFPGGRSRIVCLLVLVFYFWGMTLLVLSILRYMVPAMGLLMMFAAVFLEWLFVGRKIRAEENAGYAAPAL